MSTSFAQMLENITPDIYEGLKLAVEICKWPDQVEPCLQAVIAYEAKHLPEDQRTGYMGPQECASKSVPIENILFKSDAIH